MAAVSMPTQPSWNSSTAPLGRTETIWTSFEDSRCILKSSRRAERRTGKQPWRDLAPLSSPESSLISLGWKKQALGSLCWSLCPGLER